MVIMKVTSVKIFKNVILLLKSYENDPNHKKREYKF